MTILQILAISIAALALLLSSELVRSSFKQRKRAEGDMAPTFRQVGTFGGLGHFNQDAAPLPSTGSSGKAVLTMLIVAAFLGTGAAIKFAWDETHPDLRSAYGRAYERCVSEKKVSRWKVEEVERCIYSGRGYSE